VLGRVPDRDRFPETGVVLVKANACELLDQKLTGCGFTVLN